METFTAISKRILESLVIGSIAREVLAYAETAMNLITLFLRSITGV